MARLLIFIWALLACTAGGAVRALADPVAVPTLSRPVTDFSGTLDRAQVAQLEARLLAFEQRQGSQIAVLIVPTTQPEAIEQFAIRVAEQWKIGRRNIDDGAILVVARNDRALRIEAGYGLEGALNDATSKRIIDDIIVPRFRQDNFYGGIDAGIDAMMTVIAGEPLPPPNRVNAADGEAGWRQLLPAALVAAMVFGGILRVVLGRVVGATVTGGLIGAAAWLFAGMLSIALLAGLLGFLFTLLGGGRGGMYPGHGPAPGGGRHGGGWSGGGGGFGGGGASGRW